MATLIRLIGQNLMPSMPHLPLGNAIKGAIERGIKAVEESSLYKRVLYRNPSQIAEAALTKIEYHGSSTKALGEQIATGELETGTKLYTTSDLKVAIEHAERKAKDGSTPLIATVSGDMPHVRNPEIKLEDMGWNGVGGQNPRYHYLPPEAKKFLHEVSVLNPNGMSGLQRAAYIIKAVFKPKI